MILSVNLDIYWILISVLRDSCISEKSNNSDKQSTTSSNAQQQVLDDLRCKHAEICKSPPFRPGSSPNSDHGAAGPSMSSTPKAASKKLNKSSVRPESQLSARPKKLLAPGVITQTRRLSSFSCPSKRRLLNIGYSDYMNEEQNVVDLTMLEETQAKDKLNASGESY